MMDEQWPPRGIPTLLAMIAAIVVGVAGAPVSAAAAAAEGLRQADPFDGVLLGITRAIEVAGIAVILIGGVAATAVYLRQRLAGDRADPFRTYRASLGRAILLGLEFLVAADIIGTVAIEPTLESLAVLAGIVLIRTFLSFSLEVEIEGRLPWRKASDGNGAAPPSPPETVEDRQPGGAPDRRR